MSADPAVVQQAVAREPDDRWFEGVALAVERARDALLALQDAEGFWSFELEADCTIPAEYILMMHYMDEVDEVLQSRIAVYLRERRTADGGWPLYHGGAFDMSCSVKTYYALKLAGDSPAAPHMVQARETILRHGGAARCNVFTRITLALFGQVPWRAVPFMPVEILLFPSWFPFHLSKISYWSRTVMVPLLVLCSLKARAKNPTGTGVRELFTVPPEDERHYFPIRSRLNHVFLWLDRLGRRIEPAIPKRLRKRAVEKAEAWLVERLNGTGGLGAIFPAMVNAYEVLALLGYAEDHPYRATAKQALRRLLVDRGDSVYCQPCVSPVWDTAMACMALQETGGEEPAAANRRGLDWLRDRQLLDAPGDWRQDRPDLLGGGWPFQFENSHYPDLDDTGMVVWAMDKIDRSRYVQSARRAADWLAGMQSENGGFASFDVDNTYYYLNEIPFADHGALLDPPTSDVSARCLAALVRVGGHRQAVDACLVYLRREQERSGSWFGRWGTNYIYGTWSVLTALEEAGVPAEDPVVRRGADWLVSVQRKDGGWGEDNGTYFDSSTEGQGPASTSFQTAWALLGLMAAGRGASAAVRRGVEYLLRTQDATGLWQDDWFTAPGFPRIFYLKYHGYQRYFPLWALARYRNLLKEGQA
jgi:squalene-hopene/tetraprenyl-beta-curcumene cyclase